MRPVLVDRLARQRFDADELIHNPSRHEAETLRQRLARGELDPHQEHPRRRVIERRKDALAPLGLETPSVSGPSYGIGPLVEEPGRLVLRAILAENKKIIRVAEYAVPSVAWDGWWAAHSDKYHESLAHVAASPEVALPNAGLSHPEGGLSSSASVLPTCAVETWTSTSTDMTPEGREYHSTVWTGSHMVVWGGIHIDQLGFVTELGTGGRYDPLSDTWSAVQMLNAPSPRHAHTAVWTGSHMVIWGGYDGSDIPVNTGGRYNPLDNSWSAPTTAGAPEGRFLHTAVWMGTEMLVWGGEDPFNVPLNSGGRYDPDSDSWLPISNTGAPRARHEHTAVWTGSRMVVWGGRDGQILLKSGGRYDLSSNTWEPTSLDGAPEGAVYHTAVWTGERMVVWGGRRADGTRVGSGGRYDPTGDSWLSTSAADAPSAREFHTAVWDGAEMLIWGGNPGALNTGARYDATADAWTAISGSGAPEGRAGASAVWTGDSMLVWGGGGFGAYLLSGGAYALSLQTPGEIQADRWLSDAATLEWDPIGGEGVLAYDVMLGDLDSVSDIGAASGEECLADDLQATQLPDISPVPPIGSGRYFLIRAVDECGAGTYGWASSGAERTTSACP